MMLASARRGTRMSQSDDGNIQLSRSRATPLAELLAAGKLRRRALLQGAFGAGVAALLGGPLSRHLAAAGGGHAPLAFRELATRFDRVIIVTVNDELEIHHASDALGLNQAMLTIFCCPDDSLHEVAEWKAVICQREGAAIMFDDSPHVVQACHKIGVNAICVSERSWKFESTSD